MSDAIKDFDNGGCKYNVYQNPDFNHDTESGMLHFRSGFPHRLLEIIGANNFCYHLIEGAFYDYSNFKKLLPDVHKIYDILKNDNIVYPNRSLEEILILSLYYKYYNTFMYNRYNNGPEWSEARQFEHYEIERIMDTPHDYNSLIKETALETYRFFTYEITHEERSQMIFSIKRIGRSIDSYDRKYIRDRSNNYIGV